MPEIEERLREIEDACKGRRYDDALHLCNLLLLDHPAAYKVLWKRAYVHVCNGETERAIDDVTQVIAARPDQPCYYYDRARWLINLGRFEEAIADATDVLRLSDQWQSEYYRGGARLLRAYAKLRLGQFAAAQEDCRQMGNDDCPMWIEKGLRSRASILADAKAGSRDQPMNMLRKR